VPKAAAKANHKATEKKFGQMLLLETS